jgi:ribonuclease Y
MDLTYLIIAVIVGAGLGWLLDRTVLSRSIKKRLEAAKEKQDIMLKKAELSAESIKNDRILEAKEKYLKLKTEFEEESNRKKNQIISNENKLKQREANLSKQIEQNKRDEAETESMKENLAVQIDIIKKRKDEFEKLKSQQVVTLEKMANLTAEEAKEQLIEALKDEARTDASAHIKHIMEEANLTATKEAKKIVLQTIQRTATEHAIENCVSVFNLESDDIKGKIIGREGRNIRTLEAATGVEIIVDDTPEAIIISGFDPVRREIARLSLHRLVQDGRIHPARIEEIVSKTRKNIEEEIGEIGEKTVIDQDGRSNALSIILRSEPSPAFSGGSKTMCNTCR